MWDRWIIDRTGVIRAEIAGEAQQQVLLLAALRRLSRLVNKLVPGGVRDLACDHSLDLLLPMFLSLNCQVLLSTNLRILERLFNSPKGVSRWVDGRWLMHQHSVFFHFTEFSLCYSIMTACGTGVRW